MAQTYFAELWLPPPPSSPLLLSHYTHTHARVRARKNTLCVTWGVAWCDPVIDLYRDHLSVSKTNYSLIAREYSHVVKQLRYNYIVETFTLNASFLSFNNFNIINNEILKSLQVNRSGNKPHIVGVLFLCTSPRNHERWFVYLAINHLFTFRWVLLGVQSKDRSRDLHLSLCSNREAYSLQRWPLEPACLELC